MSTVDQIVNVTVSRETRAPSQRGFGTPILVAYHEAWNDRVREYAESDELLDDGFTTDDYVYKVFDAMKAQEPSPDTIKIGRRANAFTQVVHLIPDVLDVGYEYSVEVDGTSYAYEVQTGDDAAKIVDGLVAAMAAAVDVTVTDGTTHAIVTADTAGVVHSFKAKRGLKLFDATTDPGLLADLTAIAAEDELSESGQAYGYLLDSNSAAEIAVLHTFIESRVAVAGCQSADWSVKDSDETDDIASTQKAAAITRVVGGYHSEIGTPLAACWMAKELPKNPGQSTWAHKTLAIIPADSLSTSEKSAITGKNWSWYARVGGTNITFEGKTPAGEFIDIIHQIDFSTARVQEALFGVFTTNQKVPATNRGIQLQRAALFSALKQCSGDDYPIFDPSTIKVGDLSIDDIPAADRANRINRGLTYEARLQGAFHRVVVKGRVYV